MLIMLGALTVVACYLNGLNVLWHVAASCASAAVCEALGRKIFGCPGSLKDLSAFVTGLTIALMLPVSSPYWLAALGSAFAIVVVKIPFGGARKAPFVPAAAGWCFLSVCYSDMVFTYPVVNIGTGSPMYGTENFVSASSLSQMLRVNQSLSLNIFGSSDILTGKVPGAMGTTCVLAMLGIVAFMLLRKPSRLISSAGFIAVCAFFALAFPRVLTGRMTSLVMELSAGSLLFAAILILNDPVTVPKKPLPALIYGACAGVLCMLLRFYGRFSDNACFAVLIMNAVCPAVEEYGKIAVSAFKKHLHKNFSDNSENANVKAENPSNSHRHVNSVSRDSAEKRNLEDIFLNEIANVSQDKAGTFSVNDKSSHDFDEYDSDAYDSIYKYTKRSKLKGEDDQFVEIGEGVLEKYKSRTDTNKKKATSESENDGGDSN